MTERGEHAHRLRRKHPSSLPRWRMIKRGAPMEPVPSPCIEVCRLDPAGELCTGCGRTLAEIGAWSTASEEERRKIVARARERLK